MIHEITHILGLCGENHLSLLNLMAEWPIINQIFNYIRNVRL